MCCWLIDNLLSKRTPKIPWPNFLKNLFHFIFEGKKVVCNECFVRFCYRVSGLPSQGTLWKSKPDNACLSASCLRDNLKWFFFFPFPFLSCTSLSTSPHTRIRAMVAHHLIPCKGAREESQAWIHKSELVPAVVDRCLPSAKRSH